MPNTTPPASGLGAATSVTARASSISRRICATSSGRPEKRRSSRRRDSKCSRSRRPYRSAEKSKRCTSMLNPAATVGRSPTLQTPARAGPGLVRRARRRRRRKRRRAGAPHSRPGGSRWEPRWCYRDHHREPPRPESECGRPSKALTSARSPSARAARIARAGEGPPASPARVTGYSFESSSLPELHELREIAGTRAAEAEVLSDDDRARPEPLDEKLGGELLGRELGELASEGSTTTRSAGSTRRTSSSLRSSVVSTGNAPRPSTAEGVRIEGEDHRVEAEGLRPSRARPQDLLMPAVHTVEITDHREGRAGEPRRARQRPPSPADASCCRESSLPEEMFRARRSTARAARQALLPRPTLAPHAVGS